MKETFRQSFPLLSFAWFMLSFRVHTQVCCMPLLLKNLLQVPDD